ncbi:exodeoxyribonuclease VII large subunit [Candidatus Saccharibacteria bacterium]|nr:exodeoxyribonuclease VII large subunit [Candidatus Saccharibacteria bacterium]
MDDVVLSVSDFVGLLNQTLEYAYPNVVVQGELANLRVNKGKWVYFDLKDEYSSAKFFGTVYQLPGPLENGMMLQVRGNPRLHPQYGFSITVQTMQPIGEGSIKKAAALLESKLVAEGLFDLERKRPLPYPPVKIGLVASSESAAYHDFIKILNERWSGVEVLLADVQVQGETAISQIVHALEYLNTHEEVEVIVVTRGGGSAEDLGAFSTEQVTRAVAGSRTPTIVAIGHEIDISLAELAADQRASTPSNAAELLVPDKRSELERLGTISNSIQDYARQIIKNQKSKIKDLRVRFDERILRTVEAQIQDLLLKRQILEAFNPVATLKRGYAIIRLQGKTIRSIQDIKGGDKLMMQVSDGTINAKVSD